MGEPYVGIDLHRRRSVIVRMTLAAKALRRAVTDAFDHPVILRARSAWPDHPRGWASRPWCSASLPLDGHPEPGWPMRSVEQIIGQAIRRAAGKATDLGR